MNIHIVWMRESLMKWNMSGMGEIARVDNVGIDDNKDCM